MEHFDTQCLAGLLFYCSLGVMAVLFAPPGGGSWSRKLNSDLFFFSGVASKGADVWPIWRLFQGGYGSAFDPLFVALMERWHPNCSMFWLRRYGIFKQCFVFLMNSLDKRCLCAKINFSKRKEGG